MKKGGEFNIFIGRVKKKEIIDSWFHTRLLEVQAIFEDIFSSIYLCIISGLTKAGTRAMYQIELGLRIGQRRKDGKYDV